MRRGAALLAAALVAAMALGPAFALNPSERLDDPALEERARELSKELRCLVCQNQNIDESDADLARDLRLLVRERLSEGDTNEEVLAYLTDRYGAFVRLTPPFNAGTIALWLSPIVIAALAIAGAALYLRTRRRADPADPDTLSDAEEAALAEVLREARRD